ncbi:kinesin-like protein Klp61F [Apis cerana]|uniref:kinesin-like protein Klp61F n=1 Tax=Apis cerana TaxID=7461 RepID=UPI002B223352|nr:kinesin-like protein Klp61F [Apis cerana]
MNDTRNMKKEKKQHIQVFVRVRPTNNIEKIGKSITVVDVQSNKEVVIRERPHDKFTKKFTFDKVFGPNAKQIQVYNAVVSPLLEEVLAGYNCTVFAYGQTGTGKTFTMEGTDNDPSLHWQTDTTAGIIPRSLSHLFDELRVLEVQEYSVRASFLELYNEEIFDLLSSSDDAAKIRIYEDPTKKGAVIVHGLEEMTIHNKNEVFNILQKGSEKRQTAATLMNAHSSRSHTIFSITVHIKENTIDGEELLKTGKLNLVDLAGSENVGRSGAVDRRAREAGNINQSLLTLGRVITALAEKTPHVPYRESKLTRLLQESLGGRTRTSIIATISPASINLEETLSTLDYAHRARNITNRPEINQKFSKKALLQEYIEEIERLKKDLIACRERNGIYLTPDSYNEMQSLIEFQSKEIEEKLNHIKALEECMNSKEQIFIELKSKNSEQAYELLNIKNKLESTVNTLMSTSSRLAILEREKEEQKHLVEKHAYTENILLSQVQTVLDVANIVTSDVNKLHDKIFRKMQIGQQNKYLGHQFKNNTKEQIKNIEINITTHIENLTQFCVSVKNHIDEQNILISGDIDQSIQVISQDLDNFRQNIIHELMKNINDFYLRYQQWFENGSKNIVDMIDKKTCMLNNISFYIAQKLQQLIENKIAENLQVLNDDVSQNIDNLIEFTKETIILISKYSIEKQDCLNKKILEIKEHIKNIRQNQNDISEKRTNFIKMMDNLQCCFNEVQKEEEENHFATCNILSNIDETCELINNQALDICKMNIEKRKSLQEKLCNDLQIVKKVVFEGTDKSQLIAKSAIEQGIILINKFQMDLNKNCDTLMNYKNCVERNIGEIQKKMEEDKSLILSAINDVYMKVYIAGNEYEKCLNDCKIAFMNVSIEMSQKLENENINAANISSKIIVEIQKIFDQVDKFFTEDLYRDIPTGLTPAKKDFQYCKKLIKTSPHGRLLKKYRETLKDIEDIENEPMSNNILKEEAIDAS